MKATLSLHWDDGIEIALDEICPVCNGSGKVTSQTKMDYMQWPKTIEVTCLNCGGKGIILTDYGKTIIDYETVVKSGKEAKDKLLALESKSVLSKQPDRKTAEKLLIEINKENIKNAYLS